jgi:hypothetical protein
MLSDSAGARNAHKFGIIVCRKGLGWLTQRSTVGQGAGRSCDFSALYALDVL